MIQMNIHCSIVFTAVFMTSQSEEGQGLNLYFFEPCHIFYIIKIPPHCHKSTNAMECNNLLLSIYSQLSHPVLWSRLLILMKELKKDTKNNKISFNSRVSVFYCSSRLEQPNSNSCVVKNGT